MKIYIGIDDTDNLESKGTGSRARGLAELLVEKGLGEIEGISRHQLYVSPEIPYTSHNSSLCIGLVCENIDLKSLEVLCADFLVRTSAVGSDPGLCIAASEQLSEAITAFGASAKHTVLTKEQANALAEKHLIRLSEHGGTGGGIIGALAGVGLRHGGNDGRFVWVKGVREMEGSFTVREIYERTGILKIMTESGQMPRQEDRVEVGDWFRPVLIDGKATLLIRGTDKKGSWRILESSYLKSKY